jgi:hypothetical protein
MCLPSPPNIAKQDQTPFSFTVYGLRETKYNFSSPNRCIKCQVNNLIHRKFRERKLEKVDVDKILKRFDSDLAGKFELLTEEEGTGKNHSG